MKRIAFYLPQFHSIPENDEWWEKGFTEWTNVKNSKAQFKGHNQPEIPLNNDYYCLLDAGVQEKQSEIALKYKLDGFCYYHYWFEGKLLLEKPMENMLKNSKIQIPFCICWANETWARTWDGQEKNILIKQNYNEDKNAWRNHFEYLIQFFKDDRYIKENNKPMLLIYKPQLILKCKEMIDYWRELAIKTGFEGLFVGCQHPSAMKYDFFDLGMDFGIEFEPLFSLQEEKDNLNSWIKKLKFGINHPNWLKQKLQKKVFGFPNIHDYDLIWNSILNRKPERANMAPGAFPSWDNTPRRGNKADVYYESTPEKFKNYYIEREKKAAEFYDIPYIFINAWNEWAEGAHLEPDERNGYGYLEAFNDFDQ